MTLVLNSQFGKESKVRLIRKYTENIQLRGHVVSICLLEPILDSKENLMVQ